MDPLPELPTWTGLRSDLLWRQAGRRVTCASPYGDLLLVVLTRDIIQHQTPLLGHQGCWRLVLSTTQRSMLSQEGNMKNSTPNPKKKTLKQMPCTPCTPATYILYMYVYTYIYIIYKYILYTLNVSSTSDMSHHPLALRLLVALLLEFGVTPQSDDSPLRFCVYGMWVSNMCSSSGDPTQGITSTWLVPCKVERDFCLYITNIYIYIYIHK